VPVHESEEAILDLVRNYHYFNANCAIVLHVSMKYGDINSLKNKLPEHTYVNNNRIWSGRADGSQLLMHFMNFEYIKQNDIDCNYFSMNASNEFFVRRGLEDYIDKYDCGYEYSPIYPFLKWRIPYLASIDPFLKKNELLKNKPILYSVVEGTYYKVDIFQLIYDCCIERVRYDFIKPFKFNYKRIYNNKLIYHILKKILPTKYYVNEEVYPATFVQLVPHIKGHPYNYFNTKHNNGFVTIDEITSIVNQDFTSLPQYDRHADGRNFYTVKRVIRKNNNPVRDFIIDKLMN
jgi:hypothetical protein